ncbi:MAG: tyrosine-type recombinase/integrase, partial [Chloroflexi bacterium]|nr:tyrosine-type recombinase/integrase [Chloroflexota bacterium]
MARLRERKDRGNWVLDYIDPADGKRYQVNVGDTKEIAEVWLAKCQEKTALVRLGQIDRVGKLTQDDIDGKRKQAEERRKKQLRIADYHSFHETLAKDELNHKADTISVYRNAFSSFQTIIGNKFVHDITVDDIRRWRSTLRKKGRSKTSESMWGRALKAAWNRAIKEGYTEANPFREVKFPGLGETRRKDKSMKVAEVEKLLSTTLKVGGIQLWCYFQFLLNTGLRRQEILTIKGKDIDQKNNVLTATITKKRGEPLTMKVPINKILRGIINDMDLTPDEYVFKTTARKQSYRKKGNPWNKSYVTHKFREMADKAGLPEQYPLHSLRRTYVTLMHEKGIPTNVI